jgi:hypothetical protein
MSTCVELASCGVVMTALKCALKAVAASNSAADYVTSAVIRKKAGVTAGAGSGQWGKKPHLWPTAV